MNATPRAEQFEDRLKTIIHSVLSGDTDQREAAAANNKVNMDIKPPLHILPSNSTSPHGTASSSKPMFSPVKKELPTHLPLPPSGIVCSETGASSHSVSLSRSHPQSYPSSSNPQIGRGPAGGPIPHSSSSSLTMTRQANIGRPQSHVAHHHVGGGEITSRALGDVISNEVEKGVGGPPLMPRSFDERRDYHHPGYPPHPTQIKHEGGPTANHPSVPRVAHSNPVTSRIPTSSIGPISSRGGAPSMARMSQGKLRKFMN